MPFHIPNIRRQRYALRRMDPFRLKKAEELRSRGLQPYAAKFERTATLQHYGLAG